ncbi:DNA replication/repair protein RecF [Paraglaciecola aquimarina]|uniref:DNA replication and repair protein RecF n=1 Tax=Paraglaciecola aquimarina TaxID=1235557 RepID=A0ABU3STQ6_9ALTE|nr:DNA replication/repair protein RecF [Paraglaciecola aquimarina]MDU0353358.1 DNA replication/repair protein RecF [Paraglaciecola aquimarina]
MKLDKVQIRSFRNIKELSLVPNRKLNLFIGDNGSGKSSILEAIHYLGFARSFRTNKHKNVIKTAELGFTVFCAISKEGVSDIHRLGLARDHNDTCTININGEKRQKATELASHLPIQIFTPQSSDLLLGAPKLRRTYLDWLLFHVEQPFNSQIQIFRKSLKQLNSIYKTSRNNQEKQYWLELFQRQGEAISDYRESLLNDKLIELINLNLKDFLPEIFLEISYYRGWEKGVSLADALAKNIHRDQKNGFVSVGPHKADLRIKAKGIPAQELLSRGQLRMLVAAMQLAQTQYLYEKTGKTSVYLLDDIGAELDEEKRKVFINKLYGSDSQLFVTAIDLNELDFLNNYNDKAVFHVEHGQVREEI